MRVGGNCFVKCGRLCYCSKLYFVIPHGAPLYQVLPTRQLSDYICAIDIRFGYMSFFGQ